MLFWDKVQLRTLLCVLLCRPDRSIRWSRVQILRFQFNGVGGFQIAPSQFHYLVSVEALQKYCVTRALAIHPIIAWHDTYAPGAGLHLIFSNYCMVL